MAFLFLSFFGGRGGGEAMFQFKFLHGRISTNKFLFRIGLRGDGNCSFCQTSFESIIHLFWSCRQTSHFWNRFTEWLKNLNLLPRDYTLTNLTALGLRPNSSQFALLINYCFLLARYHIWLAKTKGGHPNLTHLICTLKSRYEIEKKKWRYKEMETSCRIYEDLIDISNYIFYTYLYLSPSISNLLSGAYLISSIMYHMPLVCFLCLYRVNLSCNELSILRLFLVAPCCHRIC